MRYVFFFPHLAPSGVSSLFARLAQAIVAAGSAEARVIDFRNGAMARSAEVTCGVGLIEFRRDKTIEVGPGETLVMQAEVPGKFRRQLKVHPGARILEWQLHPYNLVPPLFPLIGLGDFWLRRPGLYRAASALLLPCQKRNIVDFITLAAGKRSLFFHDLPALQATEKYLGISVPNQVLLPVPVNVEPVPERTGRISAKELHVAWVGRLYDFKIHILVHAIRRFFAYSKASRKRIVFHIVGDGPHRSELAQFGDGADGLKLIRYGDMSAGDLRKLLVERVDLVASMGTAALEGAALGLPVILLDIAYSEVPRDYQFRWLFQAIGFELGHTITTADCDETTDSFGEILAALEADYAYAAQRCYAYVRQHHAMQSVTTRFLELATDADLRFGDVPAHLWRKSLTRRLYERIRY